MVRAADLGRKSHFRSKGFELCIPDGLSVFPADDNGLHVVREDFLWDAAVVGEGIHHAAHERSEIASTGKFDVLCPGLSKDHRESGNLMGGVAFVEVGADTPIHLCLAAVLRLVATYSWCGFRGSPWMNVFFDDADPAVIAGSLQMFEDDHTVEDTSRHEFVDLWFERFKFGCPHILGFSRGILGHVAERGILRNTEFLTDCVR